MSKTKVWVATVHIVINDPEVTSEAGACDWVSGLLSDDPKILDWSYVEDHEGAFHGPQPVEFDLAEYSERDFVEKMRCLAAPNS